MELDGKDSEIEQLSQKLALQCLDATSLNNTTLSDHDKADLGELNGKYVKCI